MTRNRLVPLAVLAVAAIAFGQVLVVNDGIMAAHPHWPPWARWVVAAGFELAILVTGMAVILTGDRRLLVGEVGLVALSVATAWWTILAQDGPVPRWVQAATLGLMPLQYLIATASLHRLYTLGQSRRSSGSSTLATTTRRRRVETETTESVLATTTAPDLAALSAGQMAKIEEYVAAVATVGRDDEAVAGVLGVSERTVRRYRSLARDAGSLPETSEHDLVRHHDEARAVTT